MASDVVGRFWNFQTVTHSCPQLHCTASHRISIASSFPRLSPYESCISGLVWFGLAGQGSPMARGVASIIIIIIVIIVVVVRLSIRIRV